jgi:hypothetical protein
MTADQAIKELKELQKSSDTELAHSLADDILCDLLEELGLIDVVIEYEKIEKWFA